MSFISALVRCGALGLLALAGCVTDPASGSFARSVTCGLERARIVYIGEKHDDPSHHQFQEEIIRSLHRQGTPVTVGMEMIDLTQQAALDDYLDKRISWNEFVLHTAFDRGWGRTSPAYARILSWCRRNEVPVIALNAPQTVTRKLARNEPLTAEEKQLVPTYPEPPGGFKQFQTAIKRWRVGFLPGCPIIPALWSCSSAAFMPTPGPACPGMWRESPTLRRSFFFQHEIRAHRPRLQVVAGIVDAGFCDPLRKFISAFALIRAGGSYFSSNSIIFG
jgi:hypothetical protein